MDSESSHRGQVPNSLAIEKIRGLYEQRTVSPIDVVRSVYSRISTYHDKAVWITLVPEDEARSRAEELSQKYPDPLKRPPLFGIPFSVKDSIDIAGMLTTLACPSYAYTATATAPVVQRILDAGGILIGKTNLDQFATGLNGTRSPYGIPRCVHDPDYISGGSSSGSVVSVAANLVSFTVATDTAGSTRVPAALNGMVGLKPTLGTISTVGLVPACKTADCITIIAPTVDSTMAALNVMQAYDEDDVYARDPQQLALLASQPAWQWPAAASPLRYGLPPQDLLDSCLSPSYAHLFTRFLAALPSLNATPASHSPFTYAPFAAANAMLYGSSIVSQRIVAFKDYLATLGLSQLHPVIKTIFEASSGFDAVQAYEDIFALAGHRRLARKQFRGLTSSDDGGGIDVLILPSTALHPTVAELQADPIELNKRLGSFTHFVNLLDLCAVSVPVGGASWESVNGRDMPFGVTLVALPGREREMLEVGRGIMALRV
ncbi:allophanate hydrolase [Cyphellophora europaea CBS 101466]|uniref:Allophanate hydrolase n=1 Tax=Cyphellophora europaea (strain CBS 101466) TaxID=1220924 RepID=W2RNC9_CYPE1|nr:allophanate hydrolase [Cyphellophora europaea CBS 101466]ETN37957.1 allophanate hydrolase [Cyphellophora europaea CBS 101466]